MYPTHYFSFLCILNNATHCRLKAFGSSWWFWLSLPSAICLILPLEARYLKEHPLEIAAQERPSSMCSVHFLPSLFNRFLSKGKLPSQYQQGDHGWCMCLQTTATAVSTVPSPFVTPPSADQERPCNGGRGPQLLCTPMTYQGCQWGTDCSIFLIM